MSVAYGNGVEYNIGKWKDLNLNYLTFDLQSCDLRFCTVCIVDISITIKCSTIAKLRIPDLSMNDWMASPIINRLDIYKTEYLALLLIDECLVL